MTDLFSPLTLRSGATLPNRLALAPLTNLQSHDDGTLSPAEERWLLRRARGGFGVVSTCAAHVLAEGKTFDGQLGCFDDGQLPGLTALARGIRSHGALGVVQLMHGGARGPRRLTGVEPSSASVVDEGREGVEPPRALRGDELPAIVDAFVAAAVRAARAGFSGVEVHAAHGYLLTQFLSSRTNLRGDAWGGSGEGRMRLTREIARRTRAAVSPPFFVGVRISPEDHGLARGLDLDESLELATRLAYDGVDCVHVSLWDGRKPTQKRPSEHPVPLFRAALPREVALVAAGGVFTREDAEWLLSRGADVVALGRAAILDPDWPVHARAPGFVPRRGPLTHDEYLEVDVSPIFARYLERFDGMVAV